MVLKSAVVAGFIVSAALLAGCHRYDDNDGRAVSRTTTTYSNARALAPQTTTTVVTASAPAPIYQTEHDAMLGCGSDQVVSLDRDQGSYYLHAQRNYALARNGGFICLTTASRDYRPGLDSATTTTVTRQTTLAPPIGSGSSGAVTETTTTRRY
jgi:hypothetical protein